MTALSQFQVRKNVRGQSSNSAQQQPVQPTESQNVSMFGCLDDIQMGEDVEEEWVPHDADSYLRKTMREKKRKRRIKNGN